MLPTLLPFTQPHCACICGARPLQTAQRTGHPMLCLCQQSQKPGPPANCVPQRLLMLEKEVIFEEQLAPRVDHSKWVVRR